MYAKEPSVDSVLYTLSTVALASLIVYQYLHYTIASWRHWTFSPASTRFLYTCLVALAWAAFGTLNLTIIPSLPSYIDGLPYTVGAIFAPSILVIFALAVSRQFRTFADHLSIPWLVDSFAGPARRIVGVIFLFWYFAGRLPGTFAWIAGPGDWISGFIAAYAVRALGPFKDVVNAARGAAGVGATRHWSAGEFVERRGGGGVFTAEEVEKMGSGLKVAVSLVGFGMADFVAAPASTAVCIAMGNVPEEMGNVPLAIVPLLLVPQVLVLEVLAMRQFWVLGRELTKERLKVKER